MGLTFFNLNKAMFINPLFVSEVIKLEESMNVTLRFISEITAEPIGRQWSRLINV